MHFWINSLNSQIQQWVCDYHHSKERMRISNIWKHLYRLSCDRKVSVISIGHEVTGSANFLLFVVDVHNQKNVKSQKEVSDIYAP